MFSCLTSSGFGSTICAVASSPRSPIALPNRLCALEHSGTGPTTIFALKLKCGRLSTCRYLKQLHGRRTGKGTLADVHRMHLSPSRRWRDGSSATLTAFRRVLSGYPNDWFPSRTDRLHAAYLFSAQNRTCEPGNVLEFGDSHMFVLPSRLSVYCWHANCFLIDESCPGRL